MKKLVFLVAVLLTVSVTTPLFAKPIDPVETYSTLASQFRSGDLFGADDIEDVTCIYCSYGMYVFSTSYGLWYSSGTENCIHYIFGYDVIESRAVIESAVCNFCGYGFSNPYIESRIKQCRGTNIL